MARPPYIEYSGAAYAAYAVHGYALMGVGEHLGLHYSTVSKRRRRVREQRGRLADQDLTPSPLAPLRGWAYHTRLEG
jgi:transposase